MPHKNNSSTVVLFNKPFNTLCQFTGEDGDSTLADYIPVKRVYPAGRLDKDSEGLLLLTSDGRLQHRISHPKFFKVKTYWVQVEGAASEEQMQLLRHGVELKDGKTRGVEVRRLEEQEYGGLWDREPPIRYRKNDVTTWLELKLTEGRNRQVRRMTAAVGLPTLRLIRMAMGPYSIAGLKPGEYVEVRPKSLD